MIMRTKLPSIAVFSLLLFFGQLSILQSAENYSVKDWNTIINLSGKQRMLTQKMSKELLLIAASSEIRQLNTQDIYGDLLESSELFEQTLIGLRDGDDELGLRPAKSDAIKAKIDKTMAMWKQFKPNIDLVLTTTDTKNYIEVASQSLPLLSEMNNTVQLIEKDAISESGQIDGIIINYAGRERMLIQKMAKEALLVYLKSENRNALFRSMWMFEETLMALINGGKITKDNNERITIPKIKDPISLAQLNKVYQSWSGYKTLLNNPITKKSIVQISGWSTRLLAKMNTAVKMIERNRVRN